MKISIKALGRRTFERLAHKLKLRSVVEAGKGSPGVELYAPNENMDVYLWDWEYGLVKTDESAAKTLARVVKKAIERNSNIPDGRTFKFSHICTHHKDSSLLEVFYYGENGVDAFKEWAKLNSSAFN